VGNKSKKQRRKMAIESRQHVKSGFASGVQLTAAVQLFIVHCVFFGMA